MSNESGQAENHRSKPDGSAYAAHMAALGARNDAARKVGKAQRKERDEAKDKGIRETAKRQDAALRQNSGHRSR